MLTDKIQERAMFVEHRDKFERCYQAMVADFAPKGEEGTYAARLNSLLQLHAEITTAPTLYTLRSAAEVGFAQVAMQQAAAEAAQGNSAPAAQRRAENTNGSGKKNGH